MLTLTSPPTTPMLSVLQDIAQQVDVQQRFCVRHPNYKDYDLPTSVIEQMQRLPAELQQRAWVHHIRSFLYGIYYNGSLHQALAPDSKIQLNAQPIENNSLMGVDLAFYDRLHQSNQGQGYFDAGWRVIAQEDPETLIVQKHELKLHIQRAKHLSPETFSAIVGDTVAIRMPKNLVQNGFYMAIADVGSEPQALPPGLTSALVRVYFSLSTEGSVAVMASLTQHLNDQKLPFSFKTLYNPGDYGRRDSGVLYFERSLYEHFWPILGEVYRQHQHHFGSDVPLFTKPLARGLGLAEESDFHFVSPESFGMNRCQIIAHGLLAGVGSSSLSEKLEHLRAAFAVHNLDWQRPYLNAHSEDFYRPLD